MLSIQSGEEIDDVQEDVDPIDDIIDYLVRCAKISFRNAHVDEEDIKTAEKVRLAHSLFKRAPIDFLKQFGKFMSPNHLGYFEKSPLYKEDFRFRKCLDELQIYHSDESTRKRIRNRRYNALQKLQKKTDYFSEKQMMFRNPLLYEQLVGQYLTDDEIRDRDGVDNENLTFLNMILETVDRNEMREKKNEQLLKESNEILNKTEEPNKDHQSEKKWGDFDVPDTRPSFTPETRKQTMISAPERNLLKQEFLQEMYNSFINGEDLEVEYQAIDNDEQYDDLQQVTQDAEDKYFDSETNDEECLEAHMKMVAEKHKTKTEQSKDDPLDVFMEIINNKINNSTLYFTTFLFPT